MCTIRRTKACSSSRGGRSRRAAFAQQTFRPWRISSWVLARMDAENQCGPSQSQQRRGKKSYHMKGMAVDRRIGGIDLKYLHKAAKSLKGGGVGYYPKSQFVHIDTGPVRSWS